MRKITEQERKALERAGAKITVTKRAPKKKAPPPKAAAPKPLPDNVDQLKAIVGELQKQNETLKTIVEVMGQRQMIIAQMLDGDIEITKRDKEGFIKRFRPVPGSAGVSH